MVGEEYGNFSYMSWGIISIIILVILYTALCLYNALLKVVLILQVRLEYIL